jgi:hypothetical protein
LFSFQKGKPVMSSESPNRVQRALEGYAGAYNCAQAVAAAFQDLSGLTAEQLANHAHNGGGRAPGGICGALHAGLELLDDGAERDTVTAQFVDIVGSTQCREIRKAKQVACAGCVETAATLVDAALCAKDKNSSDTGR